MPFGFKMTTIPHNKAQANHKIGIVTRNQALRQQNTQYKKGNTCFPPTLAVNSGYHQFGILRDVLYASSNVRFSPSQQTIIAQMAVS